MEKYLRSQNKVNEHGIFSPLKISANNCLDLFQSRSSLDDKKNINPIDELLNL